MQRRTRSMRSILIDPTTRIVTEAEHDGSLKSMYQIIGCELVDALLLNGSIFEDGHNSVFFDDEGLDEDSPPKHFFELDTEAGRTPPIPGKGLVCGGDHEGATVDTTMTVDEVKRIV